MAQTEKIPKVSVCVITYNQEKYIRQCLQSIVAQETDFDFEVIVGDDCSTDSTASIVQEFAERYPKLIKTIPQKTNSGGGCGNYLTVHRAAKGDYVAHIDGDDAMLPGKLQCQAKLMDENPYYLASIHLMEIMDANSIRTGRFWLRDSYSTQLSIEDILMGHPNIGHSSLMYRRACLREFIFNRNSDFIDLHIYLALASIRPLMSINETLGLYRIGVGASAEGKVLDLAFDAVNNARYAVSEKIINAAGLRFANSFAKKMLIDKRHDLFMKYWEFRIIYKGRPNLFDSAIKCFTSNRFAFIFIANFIKSYVWTKKHMKSLLRPIINLKARRA